MRIQFRAVIFIFLLQLSTGWAGPRDSELVEFVMVQANTFSTLGQFVQKAGLAEAREKELTELLTKKGLVDMKMPNFTPAKSATELWISQPFQKPVKFGFSFKPKWQLIVGTKVIELKNKSAETLYRNIELALNNTASVKFPGSILLEWLLPKAEAFIWFAIPAAIVAAVFLAEQGVDCMDGDESFKTGMGKCIMKSDAAMILNAQRGSKLKTFRCEYPHYQTIDIGNGRQPIGIALNENGEKKGEVKQLFFTYTDSSRCQAEVKDYKIIKYKGPCSSSLAKGVSPTAITGIPIDRFVRCCKNSKCLSEVGTVYISRFPVQEQTGSRTLAK